MTKPLALLLYEKPVPGSQLKSLFEELAYRVVTVADPALLVETARQEMPMIVVADITNRRGDVLQAISALHADEATAHVPVLAHAPREDEKQREAALQVGVKVLATDATIVAHLPQFLEHALQLE